MVVTEGYINNLKEREKELICLYSVDNILKNNEKSRSDKFMEILKAIPSGWQFPGICNAKIIYESHIYKGTDFRETCWAQSSNIVVDNNISGRIWVFYQENKPFLPQEQKLLNTIAERIGNFLFFNKLEQTIEYLKRKKSPFAQFY